MEPKPQDLGDLLAPLFEETFDQPLDSLLKSLSTTKEALKSFVASFPIYEFDKTETHLRKKQLVKLRLLLLESKEEIPTTVPEMIDIVLKVVKPVPYLRFNKFQGHFALFEETLAQNPNLLGTVLKNKDGKEIVIKDPDFAQKRAFSKEHGKHIEGILKKKLGKNVKFVVDGLVTNRNGIYLGVQKFKSINELKQFFGNLLKNSKLNEPIENPAAMHLRELLKFHDKGEEKLKDLDHFEVGMNEKFKETRSFFIVRGDGKKEDFSFVKCVKAISDLANC